jgi:CheY-like chemotaxis protein/DNA-binding XRE family transcriptional regulator
VRKRRHGLDISQAALAERAGLHQTYIAEIESGGRNLTLKSVDKLARALQVSTAALLAAANELEGPPSGAYVDILMVEDNREDVELTLSAFRQARITNSMQVVHDGKEALDFLFCTGRFARRKMEDRPQLVLLDLNLPNIIGIEVLRRIKLDARTRSIPVVVLTASRDVEQLSECLRLGASASIVKPVDLETLGAATPRLHLDWALLKQPQSARI